MTTTHTNPRKGLGLSSSSAASRRAETGDFLPVNFPRPSAGGLFRDELTEAMVRYEIALAAQARAYARECTQDIAQCNRDVRAANHRVMALQMKRPTA